MWLSVENRYSYIIRILCLYFYPASLTLSFSPPALSLPHLLHPLVHFSVIWFLCLRQPFTWQQRMPLAVSKSHPSSSMVLNAYPPTPSRKILTSWLPTVVRGNEVSMISCTGRRGLHHVPIILTEVWRRYLLTHQNHMDRKEKRIPKKKTGVVDKSEQEMSIQSLIFIEHFPCVRHCVVRFVCIILLKSHERFRKS